MERDSKHTTLRNLSKRLKEIRKKKHLTLEQLSETAGVSKAMLSQIELGKVNPTVVVVIKISQALGIQVSELLGVVGEDQNVLRVMHANDDIYTFRSDDLCNIRTLSPLELEKQIEFYRVTLETDGQLISEGHFSGTEEVLYLAKGKIEIISGEQCITVNKGDSVHYRADVRHIIKNTAKGQAEAFMIVKYHN